MGPKLPTETSLTPPAGVDTNYRREIRSLRPQEPLRMYEELPACLDLGASDQDFGAILRSHYHSGRRRQTSVRMS